MIYTRIHIQYNNTIINYYSIGLTPYNDPNFELIFVLGCANKLSFFEFPFFKDSCFCSGVLVVLVLLFTKCVSDFASFDSKILSGKNGNVNRMKFENTNGLNVGL